MSLCSNPVFNSPFSPDKHPQHKDWENLLSSSWNQTLPHDHIQRGTALKYIHTLQRSLSKLQKQLWYFNSSRWIAFKSCSIKKKNKTKWVNPFRKNKFSLFMSQSSKALPQPALKNQIYMRYWNKNPWQAAVIGPASPTDTNQNVPELYTRKAFPEIAQSSLLGSLSWHQVTDPVLLTSSLSLAPASTSSQCLEAPRTAPFWCTNSTNQECRAQAALRLQWSTRPGVTGSRQNGWLSSSRHNQQQPFLFIPPQQTRRGLCKGRFAQGTWLCAIKAPASVCDGLTVPRIQLLLQQNTGFIFI